MRRYLPRRATQVTSRPATALSTEAGAAGLVRRSSRMVADSIRLPTSSGSSWRRTVSTSGSSGISRRLTRQVRPWVGLEVGLLELLAGEVRVELGGREIGVPEHLLDRAEVAATGEQVRREGVTQRVRAHPVRQPRRLRVAQHDLVEALTGQRAAAEVEKELALTVVAHQTRPARVQVDPDRRHG